MAAVAATLHFCLDQMQIKPNLRGCVLLGLVVLGLTTLHQQQLWLLKD